MDNTEIENVGVTAEKKVVDESVEKAIEMTGEREGATNAEVLIEGVDKDAPSEGIVFPAFFIDTSKRSRVEVDVLFRKSDGRIVSVSKKGVGIDFSKFSFFGRSQEWVEFTQPTYDEIAGYRQRSMIFDAKSQRAVVDPVRMRNMYLIFHLKDWSLRGASGEKVNLEFEPSGALTDDCLARVVSVMPSFMDVILTIYEKECLLS